MRPPWCRDIYTRTPSLSRHLYRRKKPWHASLCSFLCRTHKQAVIVASDSVTSSVSSTNQSWWLHGAWLNRRRRDGWCQLSQWLAAYTKGCLNYISGRRVSLRFKCGIELENRPTADANGRTVCRVRLVKQTQFCVEYICKMANKT